MSYTSYYGKSCVGTTGYKWTIMTTTKQTDKSVFLQLINSATNVFSFLPYEMKEKFKDYSVCIMEYHEKAEYEKNVVEVRFEQENATLSCIFGANNKCNASWLFFDEHDDVLKYVEYLKENFVYDYLTGRWLISNCYMVAKQIDGITAFMFYQ